MPARFGDIVRACAQFGISCEKPRSGSHYKLKKQGSPRPYPIPAHNGERTEIDDVYIRGLCRNFQIPEDAFRLLL